ncbi:hypothetical protein F4802DRAFT_327003 [Xylaria palmicola]|nr:hypothetical protein F4802DRAFT_327003 [Xylaria palmicola]
MHWCASTGTRYRLLKLNNVSEVSRNNVVTIIAVVSFAVALVVAFVVARGTWVARSNVSKAKHVVLAAAIFDRAGRILVSPDGLLPNEKITDTYVERTTSDTLSIENPIFQWMFQASRNWDDINGMIGNMTNHLMQLSGNGRGRSVRLMGENGQLTADYDVIFRELFCLAAVGLANRFKEQLSNVGVLWDDILPTGKARQYYPKENTGDGDSCERGDSTSIREPQGGWGSLMFLVRRLEHASDVEKFEAAGYRFADIRQVSGIIRSNMQIKTVNLSHTLANMATYAEQDTIEDSAVRLGFFGIRARLDGRGFDVLVEKGARNLLPASKLPLKRLEPWHASFLRQFDGLRMTLFQQSLRDASRTGSAEETEFISMLAGAISALRGRINDRIFNEATFSCRTIQVPCSSRPGSNAAEECTMIVIHFLMPIHFSPDNSGCEFIPLSFFKVYQMASRNSPYQAVFTQHLHREFLPAIKGIEATIHEPSHRSAQRGRQQSWYSRSQSLARDLYDRRPSILRSAVAEEGPIPTKMNKLSSNNSSRTILESPGLEKISTPDIPGTILAETSSGTNQRLQKVTSLGGILVSQEVKIAVSRAEETGTPPSRQDGQFEMGSLDPREQMVGQALGSTAAASGSAHEAMTFVDELFSACIESRWM